MLRHRSGEVAREYADAPLEHVRLVVVRELHERRVQRMRVGCARGQRNRSDGRCERECQHPPHTSWRYHGARSIAHRAATTATSDDTASTRSLSGAGELGGRRSHATPRLMP